MEKKRKKLQLRKETIAVLNGEKMTHVIGGTGFQADPNNPTGFIENTIQFVCPDELMFNPAITLCDFPFNMGTSQNGEICQDTVKSFQNCHPTYKETQCKC